MEKKNAQFAIFGLVLPYKLSQTKDTARVLLQDPYFKMTINLISTTFLLLLATIGIEGQKMINVIESSIKLGTPEADDPDIFSGAKVVTEKRASVQDLTMCIR